MGQWALQARFALARVGLLARSRTHGGVAAGRREREQAKAVVGRGSVASELTRVRSHA